MKKLASRFQKNARFIFHTPDHREAIDNAEGLDFTKELKTLTASVQEGAFPNGTILRVETKNHRSGEVNIRKADGSYESDIGPGQPVMATGQIERININGRPVPCLAVGYGGDVLGGKPAHYGFIAVNLLADPKNTEVVGGGSESTSTELEFPSDGQFNIGDKVSTVFKSRQVVYTDSSCSTKQTGMYLNHGQEATVVQDSGRQGGSMQIQLPNGNKVWVWKRMRKSKEPIIGRISSTTTSTPETTASNPEVTASQRNVLRNVEFFFGIRYDGLNWDQSFTTVGGLEFSPKGFTETGEFLYSAQLDSGNTVSMTVASTPAKSPNFWIGNQHVPAQNVQALMNALSVLDQETQPVPEEGEPSSEVVAPPDQFTLVEGSENLYALAQGSGTYYRRGTGDAAEYFFPTESGLYLQVDWTPGKEATRIPNTPQFTYDPTKKDLVPKTDTVLTPEEPNDEEQHEVVKTDIQLIQGDIDRLETGIQIGDQLEISADNVTSYSSSWIEFTVQVTGKPETAQKIRIVKSGDVGTLMFPDNGDAGFEIKNGFIVPIEVVKPPVETPDETPDETPNETPDEMPDEAPALQPTIEKIGEHELTLAPGISLVGTAEPYTAREGAYTLSLKYGNETEKLFLSTPVGANGYFELKHEMVNPFAPAEDAKLFKLEGTTISYIGTQTLETETQTPGESVYKPSDKPEYEGLVVASVEGIDVYQLPGENQPKYVVGSGDYFYRVKEADGTVVESPADTSYKYENGEFVETPKYQLPEGVDDVTTADFEGQLDPFEADREFKGKSGRTYKIDADGDLVYTSVVGDVIFSATSNLAQIPDPDFDDMFITAEVVSATDNVFVVPGEGDTPRRFINGETSEDIPVNFEEIAVEEGDDFLAFNFGKRRSLFQPKDEFSELFDGYTIRASELKRMTIYQFDKPGRESIELIIEGDYQEKIKEAIKVAEADFESDEKDRETLQGALTALGFSGVETVEFNGDKITATIEGHDFTGSLIDLPGIPAEGADSDRYGQFEARDAGFVMKPQADGTVEYAVYETGGDTVEPLNEAELREYLKKVEVTEAMEPEPVFDPLYVKDGKLVDQSSNTITEVSSPALAEFLNMHKVEIDLENDVLRVTDDAEPRTEEFDFTAPDLEAQIMETFEIKETPEPTFEAVTLGDYEGRMTLKYYTKSGGPEFSEMYIDASDIKSILNESSIKGVNLETNEMHLAHNGEEYVIDMDGDWQKNLRTALQLETPEPTFEGITFSEKGIEIPGQTVAVEDSNVSDILENNPLSYDEGTGELMISLADNTEVTISLVDTESDKVIKDWEQEMREKFVLPHPYLDYSIAQELELPAAPLDLLMNRGQYELVDELNRKAEGSEIGVSTDNNDPFRPYRRYDGGVYYRETPPETERTTDEDTGYISTNELPGQNRWWGNISQSRGIRYAEVPGEDFRLVEVESFPRFYGAEDFQIYASYKNEGEETIFFDHNGNVLTPNEDGLYTYENPDGSVKGYLFQEEGSVTLEECDVEKTSLTGFKKDLEDLAELLSVQYETGDLEYKSYAIWDDAETLSAEIVLNDKGEFAIETSSDEDPLSLDEFKVALEDIFGEASEETPENDTEMTSKDLQKTLLAAATGVDDWEQFQASTDLILDGISELDLDSVKQLPEGLQTISVKGITALDADVIAALPAGLTELYSVDLTLDVDAAEALVERENLELIVPNLEAPEGYAFDSSSGRIEKV